MIRIYPPDGLVKVSAPLRLSDRRIRQQLQEKSGWIRAQRERIQQQPLSVEEPLQSGTSIVYQGKNYLVLVTEHHGPSQLKINGTLLHCYIKENTSDSEKNALLERWYRRQMESLLPELIVHWSAIIGVEVKEWGIKKMKTRWGSCNTRAHRIWLNLNLIKKPQICLEYVLVHELVHLLEASHNQRFYQLMTQFMPRWREYQKVLEGHQTINECAD